MQISNPQRQRCHREQEKYDSWTKIIPNIWVFLQDSVFQNIVEREEKKMAFLSFSENENHGIHFSRIDQIKKRTQKSLRFLISVLFYYSLLYIRRKGFHYRLFADLNCELWQRQRRQMAAVRLSVALFGGVFLFLLFRCFFIQILDAVVR